MESFIKETFKFLANHAGQLSQGQFELIKGMKRHYQKHKQLSEKQLSTLLEIKKYCHDVSEGT